MSTMTSPTPSSDTASGSSASSASSSDIESESAVALRCGICRDTYTQPKVLSCFHTFCHACLTRIQESTDRVVCPACHTETYLSSAGLAGLLPDFAVVNAVEELTFDRSSLTCTGCKGGQDGNAGAGENGGPVGGGAAVVVAHCYDCANFLCANCELAHRYMHCFEGHQVAAVSDLHTGQQFKVGKSVKCQRHRSENLVFFCRMCSVPICKECTVLEHGKGHEYYHLNEVAASEIDAMVSLAKQATIKAVELRSSSKNVEQSSVFLQQQYHKAKNDVNETFNFYCTMLEDRRQGVLRELDMAFNDKQVSLSATAQDMQEAMTKVTRACHFINKLVTHASNTEVLVCKSMIEAKLRAVVDYVPEVADVPNAYDVEFISNNQNIQAAVRNSFGFVRQNRNGPTLSSSFRRPSQSQMIENLVAAVTGPGGRAGGMGAGSPNGMNGIRSNGFSAFDLAQVANAGLLNNALMNHRGVAGSNQFDSTLNGLLESAANQRMNPPPSSTMFDKWGGDDSSSGNNGGGDIFTTADMFTLGGSSERSKYGGDGGELTPPKSQLPRTKMVYHHKFGEFGSSNGQFTEPSGVAVNMAGDILVADTNNHRIQVFDRNGDFKFHFGQCGKRDGQLLYPNRVTVCKLTGNIIVTERSPTHQVQIFTHDGQFIRKFGSTKLQHPRGVTVDNKGRIVIVECKVMRVIIFDQMGNELYKFGCSKHLEFPNGVVVNDREEIFISDNRSHCVKVFSYTGTYLRQIGGEGLTNYPIGVGINVAGEILIADNHNNFNVTAFRQDGTLSAALESRVKHAQCFDVALGEEGSIVLASRDFRIYIYHYNGGVGGGGSPPSSVNSVCSTPNFLIGQQPEFLNSWFENKLTV